MHLRKAHNSLISYKNKNHRYLHNREDKNYDPFDGINIIIKNEKYLLGLEIKHQKVH
jgi:hypothetical protein